MPKSNQVNLPSLRDWDTILLTSIRNRDLSKLVKDIETWFGFSRKDGFTNTINYIHLARVELVLNESDWEESDQVIANIKRNLK